MKTTSHPNKATGRIAQTAVAGSAAAAGLFALQHQAEAAIVYSGAQNITATFPATIGFDYTHININGVGGPDLAIRAGGGTMPSFFNAPFGDVGLGGLTNQASIAIQGGFFAKKLASGANISAALGGWAQAYGYLRRSGIIASGYWNVSNQPGFAAFRLDAGGGNYQYGWIRLKWTDSAGDSNPYPNTVTAIDWAYESTPNTAIQAGDTGPVPEPSRALLALAGAGAAFLRRRRKAA